MSALPAACSGLMYASVPTGPAFMPASSANRAGATLVSIALAMPKSMIFGDGPSPVVSVTSTLPGFRSRWMTPFSARAARREDRQNSSSRARVELMSLAVSRDRLGAADQLHHEVWPARLAAPASNTLAIPG